MHFSGGHNKCIKDYWLWIQISFVSSHHKVPLSTSLRVDSVKSIVSNANRPTNQLKTIIERPKYDKVYLDEVNSNQVQIQW
ncbi:unnamed protein product [Trifolium pratense]|uniref:Uncharacterized protein n=1 Tax=Trifolium pratense TaxID=57577 RepID=A0ACB0LZ86_TRIPR|nr:unnamed protein product [Trifolium pratense]